MRMLWTALLALTLLALLAGCPRRDAGDTTVIVDGEGGRDVVDITLPENVRGDVEVDVDVDADVRADATDASGAPVATEPAVPSEDRLAGKWFALYGRTPFSQATYTFEDGHIVEFSPDGSAAIWERNGGSDGRAAQVAWELSGGAVRMRLPATGAVLEGELGKASPLAFGRDSEIGLSNAGRDSEIGLSAQKGNPDAADSSGVWQDFKVRLDGDILIFTGDTGELFVYGKVGNPRAGSVPSVESGTWHGLVAPGQTADARIELSGQTLSASYGPNDSEFRGKFTHGYFVGPVTSTAGGRAGYAVLAPTDDDRLNGVITPDPFRDVQPEYDFARGGS